MNTTYFEITESVEHVNNLLTMDALPNIIVTVVYLLLGILGNSFVVYVYAFATKSDVNNKYFILVLAVVDTVACVVNCVFTIVLDTKQLTFTSSAFCKVLRVTCHVTALTPAFILLIIAIQRYLLVCRPFGRQMTPPWRRNFVAISVLLSCVLGFPAVVFYGPTPISPVGFQVNGTACKYEEHYIGSSELSIYNTVFMFTCIVGIGTISVLYFLVMKKIYEQRKKFKNKRGSSTNTGMSIHRDASTTDSEFQSETRPMNADTLSNDRSLKRNASLTSFAKFSIRAKRKKAKESLKYHRFSLMFITITLVCIIAFMPLRILEFLEVGDKNFVKNTFAGTMPVYRFLYTSYIINNIANPLIYGLFDREFRKGLTSICTGS